MKMTRMMTVVVGLCASMAAVAAAKTGSSTNTAGDAMAQAMAKYATPGPQHKLLSKLVGNWSVTGKMWMEPGKPPIVTSSKAKIKNMGDLWIVEEVTGDFMGKPFLGHGVQGFDIAKQKYVGTWVDNFGSYIMVAEGTADAAGKVITTLSSDVDPATGKSSTTKSVTTIDSDTKHTIAMYKTGPDGKDVELMELVYTKK